MHTGCHQSCTASGLSGTVCVHLQLGHRIRHLIQVALFCPKYPWTILTLTTASPTNVWIVQQVFFDTVCIPGDSWMEIKFPFLQLGFGHDSDIPMHG